VGAQVDEHREVLGPGGDEGARVAAQVAAAAENAVQKQQRFGRRQLHQRTFGTDVLQCPCGGRRSIRHVHSTRKQAEARLTELGVSLPSPVLPQATAPPQLLLAM
jgi:hypothetical protein